MSRLNQVGYGLDLQGDQQIVVRATRRGTKLAYEPCAATDQTVQDDVARGCALAVAMPPRQCLSPRLEAPYRSRSKAAKVFPTLLDIQLPFALEDCVYEILPEEVTQESGTRALAVVARKSDVQETIRRVAPTGLDPTRVDHEGIAVWTQSLREVPVKEGSETLPRVVIYLGKDRTTLVVGVGSRYEGAHGLIRPDLATVRRLLRSSLGSDVSRVDWLCAGPGASEETVVDTLREALTSSWKGSFHTHDDTAAFLARALAARCVIVDDLPCDLRVGELTHPAVESRASGVVRKAALLMLGAGIVMSASGFIGRTMIDRRVDAAEQHYASAVERVLGYSPGAARGEYALRIVREHVRSQQGELEPLRDMFSGSLTGVINDVARFSAEQGVRIDSIGVRRKVVECKGALREWGQGDKLGQVLEARGYYWDLVRGDALPDESIPFSIEGRVRE